MKHVEVTYMRKENAEVEVKDPPPYVPGGKAIPAGRFTQQIRLDRLRYSRQAIERITSAVGCTENGWLLHYREEWVKMIHYGGLLVFDRATETHIEFDDQLLILTQICDKNNEFYYALHQGDKLFHNRNLPELKELIEEAVLAYLPKRPRRWQVRRG